MTHHHASLSLPLFNLHTGKHIVEIGKTTYLPCAYTPLGSVSTVLWLAGEGKVCAHELEYFWFDPVRVQ